MADFKNNACKKPWRSAPRDDYVLCVIGDENIPAKKSDVESKLKEAFNSFCDNNKHTGYIDTFFSGKGSFVCCTTGRDGCNAFVYEYSSLEDETKPDFLYSPYDKRHY